MCIVYRKSYNITYCIVVVYVIVEYMKEKETRMKFYLDVGVLPLWVLFLCSKSVVFEF